MLNHYKSYINEMEEYVNARNNEWRKTYRDDLIKAETLPHTIIMLWITLTGINLLVTITLLLMLFNTSCFIISFLLSITMAPVSFHLFNTEYDTNVINTIKHYYYDKQVSLYAILPNIGRYKSTTYILVNLMGCLVLSYVIHLGTNNWFISIILSLVMAPWVMGYLLVDGYPRLDEYLVNKLSTSVKRQSLIRMIMRELATINVILKDDETRIPLSAKQKILNKAATLLNRTLPIGYIDPDSAIGELIRLIHEEFKPQDIYLDALKLNNAFENIYELIEEYNS